MQIKSISKWAVGVITADRPTSTLDQTLRSLSRAGWPEYHVFEDLDRNGAWPNWIGMLRSLIERYPQADAYLAVEDDAVFCRRPVRLVSHSQPRPTHGLRKLRLGRPLDERNPPRRRFHRRRRNPAIASSC